VNNIKSALPECHNYHKMQHFHQTKKLIKKLKKNYQTLTKKQIDKNHLKDKKNDRNLTSNHKNDQKLTKNDKKLIQETLKKR